MLKQNNILKEITTTGKFIACKDEPFKSVRKEQKIIKIENIDKSKK